MSKAHKADRLTSGTATTSEMIIANSAQNPICNEFRAVLPGKDLLIWYNNRVKRAVPIIPTVLNMVGSNPEDRLLPKPTPNPYVSSTICIEWTSFANLTQRE